MSSRLRSRDAEETTRRLLARPGGRSRGDSTRRPTPVASRRSIPALTPKHRATSDGLGTISSPSQRCGLSRHRRCGLFFHQRTRSCFRIEFLLLRRNASIKSLALAFSNGRISYWRISLGLRLASCGILQDSLFGELLARRQGSDRYRQAFFTWRFIAENMRVAVDRQLLAVSGDVRERIFSVSIVPYAYGVRSESVESFLSFSASRDREVAKVFCDSRDRNRVGSEGHGIPNEKEEISRDSSKRGKRNRGKNSV